MNLIASNTEPLPTLTLKNIPQALMDRLRASAKAQHRSVNRQAIAILENALPDKPQASFREALREFHARWGETELTEADLEGLRDRSSPRFGP
jgi:plasmid stability protein